MELGRASEGGGNRGKDSVKTRGGDEERRRGNERKGEMVRIAVMVK
jgi:hypothetical protein